MAVKWIGLCIGIVYTLHVQAEAPYRIEYFGLEDTPTLKMIKTSSQLHTLQKNPPSTIQSLQYRANSDIPTILKVLHSQGYYEATVQMRIDESSPKSIVRVMIQPGSAYTLSSYVVTFLQDGKEFSPPCIAPNHPWLRLGSRMESVRVLNAEFAILQGLSKCGYPLATIEDRNIVVDGDTKNVHVSLRVNVGHLCYFGPLSLSGYQRVKPLFFEQRVEWKEDSTYNSQQVEETQQALMDTGLFSSVSITREEEMEGNVLPMRIDVNESKHKSIYGGVSYQTYYGPGLTFGWENRNVQGLGRKLSLQGDITKRSHVGVATYQIPQFFRPDQDFVMQAKANHVDILPYTERSYQVTNRLEKKLSSKLRIAFGAEGERLFVNSSVQNGDYWIFEVPIFLGLNNANSLLNPTSGMNMEYRTIPAFAFSPDRSFYVTQKLSFSAYIPVDKDHILCLAQKISGGTILSGREEEIPVPRRFFGGSEEDLRGYAYYSVSPLSADLKPIGGRSAIYYSFEPRLRLTKTLGLVPFFDMGNVCEKQFFIPEGKWYKSTGIGVRYFSFMGPFRIDVGFPLNRRKGIDRKYRVLISLGQSF